MQRSYLSTRVADLRLKLRICVLPERHELYEMISSSDSIAPLCVELSEAKQDRSTPDSVREDAIWIAC